jgi:hypothetical protein
MLKIVRIEKMEQCVRGVMLVNGIASFVTLENPWLNNERYVSCIPIGSYAIEPFSSPKYGQTFKVLNVPNRSDIICPHVGNLAKDTKGCVLLGMFFTYFEKDPAIASSKIAMDAFRKLILTFQKMALEITEI